MPSGAYLPLPLLDHGVTVECYIYFNAYLILMLVYRHVMAGLPEFTVCEECYDIVIWPLIEDDKNTSEVTRNFIRGRQMIPVASCQLYSERMRKLFKEACRQNDMDYLVSEVKKKSAAEAEIKSQYSKLIQQDQKDPNVQRERLELIRRLKEVE